MGARLPGSGDAVPDEATLRAALLVAKGAPQLGTLVDPNLPPLPAEEEEEGEEGGGEVAEEPLDKETLSDVDEAEIAHYLVPEAERKDKSAMWHHMHKDWLVDRAQKEALAQQQPQARRKGARKKVEAQTAAEAAQALMERRLTSKSSRINWDALNMPSLLDRLEHPAQPTPLPPAPLLDEFAAYAAPPAPPPTQTAPSLRDDPEAFL